jgi:pterin-4a-carbinolamine dehydratase
MKLREIFENGGRIVKGVNTTVDVGPDEIKKQAAKFGNIVDKDGYPPTHKRRTKGSSTNVLFNLGEGKDQLNMEDRHPNDRPYGPETKPTMPKGTVRVDVSDVYDWYKLGMHISDLEGLGKHDFGKGPPSAIMSFGSEDLEHEYIQNLKKLGLTTTDIDPVDPKQPKNMKRQKTDPTYNVESVAEGKFRTNDVEEFKPANDALNDMKSKYLPDWEMLDHKTLQAKYVAQDHREAEAFVRIINKLSEKMDHFCEVTQDVAEVTVRTTTFDVKGLTILDFQIAMVIDKFASDVGIKQVRMSGNFGMHENFADGRNPQDKGDSKRHGVPTKASVSTLRKVAKQGGRKGQLAHWMANMKSGKAKKK